LNKISGGWDQGNGRDPRIAAGQSLNETAAASATHASRYLAAFAAISLIALGSIVTLGWIARIEILIQVLPGMLPMTRNTAACFLLSGVALLVLALNGPRWMVAAAASLIGIVGVLTLVHHLFGIVTGIAEILGPPYVPATSTGAGMALISAIAFTVGAIGLLGTPNGSTHRARMVLGITGSVVAACAVAGLTAAGILSGARGLAPHSVAGFLILGLGMLALGWHSVSDRTPRWLPIAVVIGIFSGVLGLWRTLIDGGHEPFELISVVVLAAGIVFGLSFGVTIHLAQRGFAQAAALRRAEAESRQIIDNIPAIISLFGPTGAIEYMNTRIFDFTGKTAEELLKWGATDLVHPDDRERAIAASMAGNASGQRYEIVYRMRRHDGIYRWFLAVHTPLRDESGRLYRWCVSVTDIDDRKRAEDVLRENEIRSREIVDSIPGLVVVFTADGRIERVNEQALRYYGKTVEDLENWDATGLVHPDDLPSTYEMFSRAMVSGEPYQIEVRSRRFDGVYRWVESRMVPVRGPDGTITKWYNLLVDIEDRKQAEHALRETEHNLQQTIDTIPALAWSATPDGLADFINQHYQNFVGLPPEQLLGAAWASAVHPDDLPGLLAVWQGMMQTGQGGEAEARMRRHDGEYRWLMFRTNPLRDANGTIVKWYGVNSDIEDRKRAEEALAASERKLQQTIDTMPALAWSTTPDGQADFFNQHYLDFVGLPPDELQGTKWGATVHPDDVPGLLAAWQGMVTSGQGGDAEARIRRHDGQYRWFLQRANPFRDENGTIVRWYGINTDIEDSKRAEASLAREKQLLEMIASGVQLRDVLTELCRFVEEDSVELLCDVHPIDWNTKTFRYGTSPTLPESYTAPITGLPVEDELLPCAVAAHQKVQIIAEDLDTDPRWQASYVREHALKYGLRSVWSTPIISTNGTVLGTFCIYQRKPATPSEAHQSLISHATHIASIAIERLQTEEELRRSYDRLAAAQKLSKTGNFTADVVVDNHIWSAELYRIFEFDPDKKISVQDVRGVVHPDDLPGFDADFGRSAAEGTPFDQIFRIITNSGTLKHVHALAEVAEKTQGRPVFSGAIRDVTDERVAEEALSKTRSELAHVARVTALSTLSASIAHEVSQPLAGIVTNASTGLRMLAADPPNIDGARETARRTIRDGNRASEVITRLRAMFSNRSQVSDRVDLNDAARDVIALLAGELQRKRIEIVFEPTSDLLPVSGDRVQLQQVILNLLMNATDAVSNAASSTRRITIRTEMVEADQVRLTVRDTGIGIDPELAAKLFDAFYTTKDSGMGIGLSVSRSIVEHHHGRIWASPNDDAGATFSFILPASDAPPPPPALSVNSDTRREGAK
jgi:PAS domain S-box-containing protein